MPFSRHKGGVFPPCQDLLLCHCDASELGSEILVYHGEPHLRYCLLDDVPRYPWCPLGMVGKCLQVQRGVLVWLCEDIFRLKCLSETSEKALILIFQSTFLEIDPTRCEMNKQKAVWVFIGSISLCQRRWNKLALFYHHFFTSFFGW